MYGRWGARGVYFHESHWCEGYITLCTGGQARSCFSHLKDSMCVPHVKTRKMMRMNRCRDLSNRSYFPVTSNWSIMCWLLKCCIGLTLSVLLCPVCDAFWMMCDIHLHPPFCHCLHNTLHQCSVFTFPEQIYKMISLSLILPKDSLLLGNFLRDAW